MRQNRFFVLFKVSKTDRPFDSAALIVPYITDAGYGDLGTNITCELSTLSQLRRSLS